MNCNLLPSLQFHEIEKACDPDHPGKAPMSFSLAHSNLVFGIFSSPQGNEVS